MKERAPASWRPDPEAKPQGPKVAHCGGTGVCVAQGPFAFSPLATASSNMAQPSLQCSAGGNKALRKQSLEGKQSPAHLSGCPFLLLPFYSLLLIALALIHYSQTEVWSGRWLRLSLFPWTCEFLCGIDHMAGSFLEVFSLKKVSSDLSGGVSLGNIWVWTFENEREWRLQARWHLTGKISSFRLIWIYVCCLFIFHWCVTPQQLLNKSVVWLLPW